MAYPYAYVIYLSWLFEITEFILYRIRGCGHLVCYKCIRLLSIAHLRGLVEHIPGVPTYLKLSCRTENFSLEKTTSEHLIEIRQYVPKRKFKYSCPCCRHTIEYPPVKIPFIVELISGLLEAVEGLACTAELGDINLSEGSFEDLFAY